SGGQPSGLLALHFQRHCPLLSFVGTAANVPTLFGCLIESLLHKIWTEPAGTPHASSFVSLGSQGNSLVRLGICQTLQTPQYRHAFGLPKGVLVSSLLQFHAMVDGTTA